MEHPTKQSVLIICISELFTRIILFYKERKLKTKPKNKICVQMSSISNHESSDMKSKVQERIKLMMKNKKLQKLASDKDLNIEKPASLFHGKAPSKNLDELFDDLKNFQNEGLGYKEAFGSNKRMKSTAGEQGKFNSKNSSHNNVEISSKKFALSKGAYEKEQFGEKSKLKKAPSQQKLQKATTHQSSTKMRLKRPSSVVQGRVTSQGNRSTTSRTRRKRKSAAEEKQIQDRIRENIQRCFVFGSTLHKYLQLNDLSCEQQKERIFSEEVSILQLISSCKKHFSCEDFENEQQLSAADSSNIEREIIEAIQKRYQKEQVIRNCEDISDRISRLIEDRLKNLSCAN